MKKEPQCLGLLEITQFYHVPLKNIAIVLVVSTMHHSSTIDEATNKPDIIMFDNMIKGVDALDKKCIAYS